ncbi:MAG TPA: nucleotidyltransferase family protein, partial [Clostridia bacterium]|nr:nucleotidyltransferase family protein [Clostridia bacterium]
MDTCGLTAEYNPFHKGHRKQLAMIRERFGSDAGVIVCLSGPFCQRGVPALLDKGVRARLALSEGADLVLELPQAFATASAERFAQGAVLTLLATGVVRNLAYGSERPSEHANIRKVAALLADEPAGFGSQIRSRIASGTGFAAARSQAVGHLTKNASFAALLRHPNTILAVEYEKALFRSDHGVSGVRPQDWKQTSSISTHALPLFDKDSLSASAIRDRIWKAVRNRQSQAYEPLTRDLARWLPPASLAAIMDAVTMEQGLLLDEMIAPALLMSSVFCRLNQLKQIQ